LQERLKKLKKEHGKKELGAVTLDMTIRGMRGIPVRTDSLNPTLQPLQTDEHLSCSSILLFGVAAIAAAARSDHSRIIQTWPPDACKACCGKHHF